MLEARCTTCQETFVPAHEEDLVHGWSEDSQRQCGGVGVITGEYRPVHTLESHEREMPDCDDPDCEFHHPEVQEETGSVGGGEKLYLQCDCGEVFETISIAHWHAGEVEHDDLPVNFIIVTESEAF